MMETIQPQVGLRTDLTEWQLPGRIPKLMSRLDDELIIPTRNRIQEADKVHKFELAQAKAHLSERESQHRIIFEQIERVLSIAKTHYEADTKRLAGELANFKSEAANIHAQLQSVLTTASAHIKTHGISMAPTSSIPSGIPEAEPLSSPKDYIDQARKYNDNAGQYNNTILGIVKPHRFYFPDNQLLGILAVGGSIYLAIILGGTVHNDILKVVFSVLFYALCLALLKMHLHSELKMNFRLLNGVCSTAEEYLAAGISQAENECQRAVATAETTYSAVKSQCTKETEDANETILKPARHDHDKAVKDADSHHETAMRDIKSILIPVAERLHKEFDGFCAQTGFAGADWAAHSWNDWSPDSSPDFAARIGTLTAKTKDLQDRIPDVNLSFCLPALIPFSDGRCLLLKATGKAKDTAAEAMQSAVIRACANTPPGKARFTLIDPVGLGHNVADFMHLGDFNQELISGKAWTEPQHIEQQLTKLTEDMETVIQTFLRKKFATIQDYNQEHNEVAEPFRFLVVFDFPVNFTESSARRLVSIVKNGPRCGVFALILQDTAKALPYGFNLKDLEDAATQISMASKGPGPDHDNCGFVWEEQDFKNHSLNLDGLPPQSVSNSIITKSGEMAAQGMKREVPFDKLVAATQKTDSWLVSSTAINLLVPLGPAGKGKPQELTLGGGQEAHALLVGRTGSGKTNLMHVIITNLALTYSPKELQLFLIDFKGGVGFKRYAEHQLPHAKVIAIESEREFGMSVLQGLDAELKQRSEVFRAAGVDNLAAYRAKSQVGSPMPRILLVVDEFQEFFTENDAASQQAKNIFERLARQGRSFGLHFLLATQSLSGSAQLPASIMGQIKVRIALPCSEADSRLILADDNKAARSLTQAGEAIYNPMAGLVEGNNKFQVALFNEDSDLKKYLTLVSEMARAQQISTKPIIFEGNELARAEDSGPLKELIAASDWPQSTKGVDLFLGDPIAIQSPVVARLRRQSGSNLMIVTRDESEGVGMCVSALLSIFAQQRAEHYHIVIADFTTVDSEWAEHAEEIERCFPGEISVVGKQRETGAMFATIAEQVRLRGENPPGQMGIYLVLQGMHRIKSLRENMDDEEGHNSVELLQTILRDGPEVGVHVIAWSDTFANATRGLSRKAIGEFGLRAGAAMSTEESMSFFDDLAASKISKPHRAIFSDEDRPGQLITFRPYAMPPPTWLAQTGERLCARIHNQKAV